MGALQRGSTEAWCTAMKPCWEAGVLDEHCLPASVPMSLELRTENDHNVPFDGN